MPTSLTLALKAARELGPRQTFWYAVYQAGLRSGYYRLATPCGAMTPGGDYPQLSYPLRSPFRRPQQGLLETILGESCPGVIAEADEVCAGQVRLFGGPPAPLTLTPPDARRHWTEYEGRPSTWGVEDLKLLWEPARFGWVFPLARAYAVTGIEKYPAAFWQHFETFLQANPLNCGPNWTSAQEVALRLLALLFAACAFEGSAESTPERTARLAGVIAAHAGRIPPTLSYARAQNNNHHISEALGLYAAGQALPDHPQSARWRSLGWRELNAALQRQIQPDGTYAQHSLNYHRLMLHAALMGAMLGQPYPPATQKRLAEATRWLLSQVDPHSGRAPNLGSNDGANILPLGAASFAVPGAALAAAPGAAFVTGPGDALDGVPGSPALESASVQPVFPAAFADYRPVAQAAARAFLGGPTFPPGPWDEAGLWLNIPGARRPAPADAPPRADLSETYSRAVVHRLSGVESWATLRAVRFTSRPSHADQLHVDLWWRGENVALDAGTYRYTAPAPWDNALGDTLVHNTVLVNGQSQMQRAGRFLWLEWAQAKRRNTSGLPGEFIVAEHTGYQRLGVLHRRVLRRVGPGRWEVMDYLLEGKTPPADPDAPQPLVYPYRLHWLLPDWPWALAGGTLTLTRPGGGRLRLSLAPEVPDSPLLQLEHYSLVRAGQSLAGPEPAAPVLGWYAPTYNLKLPALSFALQVRSPLPLTLVSNWVFED